MEMRRVDRIAGIKDRGLFPMAIRVDLQRISELDADIDYPSSGWFDAVPRVGEIIQFRDSAHNRLSPRTVISVNYLESEPNSFRVLVVVE
jgi:hypothetical protein